MTIAAALPTQREGVAYRECITLTGTGPFTLAKHNLGAYGSAEIIGSQLCVTIPDPSAAIDFAAEVAGACAGCQAETITSTIAFASATGCACSPAVILTPPGAMPPLVVGQYYRALVALGGTQPFEFCGGSAPGCISMSIKGDTVEISGQVDRVGPIRFSVKNACSCDCVSLEF